MPSGTRAATIPDSAVPVPELPFGWTADRCAVLAHTRPQRWWIWKAGHKAPRAADWLRHRGVTATSHYDRVYFGVDVQEDRR